MSTAAVGRTLGVLPETLEEMLGEKHSLYDQHGKKIEVSLQEGLAGAERQLVALSGQVTMTDNNFVLEHSSIPGIGKEILAVRKAQVEAYQQLADRAAIVGRQILDALPSLLTTRAPSRSKEEWTRIARSLMDSGERVYAQTTERSSYWSANLGGGLAAFRTLIQQTAAEQEDGYDYVAEPEAEPTTTWREQLALQGQQLAYQANTYVRSFFRR